MKNEIAEQHFYSPTTKTSHPATGLSARLALFLISLSGLFISQVNAQVGSWTAVAHTAPHANNGVMILLSDGSVICHTTAGGTMGDGTEWDRLTPDASGSYVNGTWTTIAGMTQERYSFSSEMLKSGKVYAAGGEYGTDGTQAGYHGEIYDPVANTWTEITGSSSSKVISDGACQILDDGRVLQGLVDVSFPVHTMFYTPSTNAYTTGPSSLHGSNEAMWLKLPDNSILYVDEDAQTSERYIPATNTWIADGNVPVALYDPYGYECGPAWMLPDGRAFFIGGTNHTAYYTPSGTVAPGTWTAGPDVPNSYGMPDAPGAMMPNGKILFACSPQPTQSNEFASPTKFYEFDPTTGTNGTYTAVNAPSTASTQAISQQYNFIVLPNGQIMCGMDQDNSSNQYYVYTPVGSVVASGKPTITGVTRLTCTTYMITGHGFNGISEGSAFGDENENSTNYPLFRFTSGTNVYYARSYNWNSTGVQRGVKNDTAYITLPAAMGSGLPYNLYAVANGIPSDSIPFVDSVASLTSPLANAVCSGSAFTYTPVSNTPGSTFTWTRPAVTGISNAAITTPQTSNPNEVLTNTTGAPVTVTYVYSVTGGGCSNTVNVTVSVNPPPVASFTGAPLSGCSVPDSVTFTNTSVAGSTYTWYFGDNNISNATSPVHPYMASGTYTVKLVTRSACGADSVIKASYVSITPPAAPVATSPVNVGCSGSATLTATQTGTDTLKWFNQPVGGSVLGTGSSFVTGALTGSTTFYVANYVSGPTDNANPTSDNFGTGGDFTAANPHGVVFNVNQNCTLVSVLVYSAATGSRTINLLDNTGAVLQTTTVNIATGTVTVPLNFPLTVGTGYQLSCGDNTNITHLYRNATGATYPYTDPSGYVTLTGNDIPDAVHYYYFYNWQLAGPACVSARTPVQVNITGGLTLTPSITNVACYGGATGSATITPTGGTPNYTYTWSTGSHTASISNVVAGNYTVTAADANGCSSTATETITQPSAALSVSVTPVSASCGASTGSATAAVSGGTAAYGYLWSNSATGASISGLAANTYMLTVTDAHSCSATAQAVIVNSGSLNLAAAGTDASCFGASTGSATVNVSGATGSVTYQWSNSATTQTISNIPSGTYNVTVSVGGGCSGTASTSVSQPSAINVSASETNTGCGAPNGTATVNVSGGTANYTYAWSNSGTTATITGLAANTYSVVVTDSHSCSASTSTVVSNTGSLNLTTTPNASNCSGSSTGGASVTVNGGTAPFTYAWSNSGTAYSISNVIAGTYQVTVHDNGGCSGTASVVIATGAALNVTSAPISAGCFNAATGGASVSISNGTSPFTFAWSNGATTSSISAVTAGQYVVTITDAHSCESIDTVIIDQPSAITLFVIPGQPTCAGLNNGNANVHATGGTPAYTYLWSNGTTGLSINNLGAGNFSVTATDNNQCTATAAFTVVNPTPVTATATATSDSCFNSSDGSITVSPGGGTGPYTYLWANSSTASVLTGLSAGPYTVTVADQYNCTVTATATVSQPSQISVTTSTTDASGGQANGTASVTNSSGGNPPYTVSWSNGGSGATITGLDTGTYTATVTDHNGCQNTATAVVNELPTAITSVINELSFSIYPNPAKTAVAINASAIDKETTLVLSDVLGQPLVTKAITSSTTFLDVAPFANGVYFIELVQNGKKAVKKFVISR